jgi:hypothetical protein
VTFNVTGPPGVLEPWFSNASFSKAFTTAIWIGVVISVFSHAGVATFKYLGCKIPHRSHGSTLMFHGQAGADLNLMTL